jgi:hypothetical protein
MSTVLRYAGQCQFCERSQKIDRHRNMVHHGYERPGTGWIEGDCPGVGFPPYQLSCGAIKLWLGQTEDWIVKSQEIIAEREARKSNVTAYRAIPSKRWGREFGKWQISPPTDYKREVFEHDTIVLHPDESDSEKAKLFAALNDQLIKHEIAHLAKLQFRADYYKKRIADWTEKPVITVEEMERIERDRKMPLARTLPKAAAMLGQALAKGTKAKLTRVAMEQLLTAIGWKVEPTQVPVKFTSTNAEDLPVVERMMDLGVPFGIPSDARRIARRNYVSPGWEGAGELSVFNPRPGEGQSPLTAEQLAAWRGVVVAILRQLPSAPPKGPTAPYDPRGLYLSNVLVTDKHEEVHASNVWVILPGLQVTAADGATFTMPEVYGVNYDMTALKPAGFYKWADAHGIREAIATLAAERG